MSDVHRQLLQAAVAHPPAYPEGRYEGRGIVICAGGARLFTCAYVAIGILRRVLGCTLPIEVWHLGAADIGPPMRRLLEDFDVAVVDGLAVAKQHPVRTLGGWELKPYAVIHSRFREVLLLDADNVPTVDPAFLCDLPEYAEAGALFWPDIVRLKQDAAIWELTGVPYTSLPTVESGQAVLDKQLCWPALQLAMHMNEHSDFYYQHIYGDKDTFFIAWRRLGQPYAMTPHAPRQDQYGLYQRGFDGRVVFQHRNSAKWIVDGRNPRVPGFQHEDACLGLLEELKGVWDGLVFLPPPASAAAVGATAALEVAQWFDLLRIGENGRALQLLSDNRIGEGRDGQAFYWSVEEDREGLCLNLHGRRRLSAKLRPQADGSWAGRALHGDVFLELSPCLARSSRAAEAASPVSLSPASVLEHLVVPPPDPAADPGSVSDLAAALRLLARRLPGFAAAMAERLQRSGGQANAALACLKAALADIEASPDGAADPRSGHGTGYRIRNMGRLYEPHS